MLTVVARAARRNGLFSRLLASRSANDAAERPAVPGVTPAVIAPRAFTEHTPVSDAQLATLDDAHIASLIEEVNDGEPGSRTWGTDA
jgi:hypothetical protein